MSNSLKQYLQASEHLKSFYKICRMRTFLEIKKGEKITDQQKEIRMQFLIHICELRKILDSVLGKEVLNDLYAEWDKE